MVARGEEEQVRSPRPSGNVNMSYCCFSGTNLIGTMGEKCLLLKQGWGFGSEKICQAELGYRLQPMALAGQCCPPVAVPSMTKPGIPSLGLIGVANRVLTGVSQVA